MNYVTDMVQSTLTPFVSLDPASNVDRLSFNVSFLPEENERIMELNVAAQSKKHQFRIPLPDQLPIQLPSAQVSEFTKFVEETQVLREFRI